MANLFWDLSSKDIAIDTSVYREVVEDGMYLHYPDALNAEQFIKNKKIAVIAVDITPELGKFRDPGETSCFILAKQGGICMTSDLKATKKFRGNNVRTLPIDTFFYRKFLQHKLSSREFLDAIERLERVFALTPERKVYYEKQARSGGK